MTGARRVSRGLAWILVACLVGGLVSNFTFSQNWVTSLILVPLTLLGWWGLPKLAPVIDRLSNRQVTLLVGVGMAVMVLLQMAVLKWLPVTVYHDPLRVLDQATRMAVGHTSWKITYFWRYPQNVPIAYLLSRWLKLTMEMGIGVNRGVHLLSMLMLDGMVLLGIDTAWRVSKKKHLVLGILAFGVLTPFAYTYYLQVFYTDLPVMFVLLYLLRTLVLWRHRNWWQKSLSGALLVLLAMLGQLTKANMIVIIPAMLLTALILWGRHRFKQSQLLVPMLLITLGVALSFPLSSTLDKAAHFTRQTDYEFPLTQWVAMGLNEKSNGVYNTKDAVANVKLKTKRNKQIATAMSKLVLGYKADFATVAMANGNEWKIDLSSETSEDEIEKFREELSDAQNDILTEITSLFSQIMLNEIVPNGMSISESMMDRYWTHERQLAEVKEYLATQPASARKEFDQVYNKYIGQAPKEKGFDLEKGLKKILSKKENWKEIDELLKAGDFLPKQRRS